MHPYGTSPRRLRLLVATSTYPARPADGTPPFVRDLALRLAERFDTLVLTPSVPGAPARETSPSLTVERFRYLPWRRERVAAGAILENIREHPWSAAEIPCLVLAEAVAMARAIRRFEPDVVHLHWLVPQGVAALLGARRARWLVTTLGGDLYALRDPVSLALKRAVVKRAQALTTMNEEMRATLIRLGADPGRVDIIPMGADVATIVPHSAGVASLPGRVAFAGRLVEKKGVAHLIGALERLQDIDWSLDVVGDGPLRARLQHRARGLPVRFLGQLPKDELAKVFAQSAVVVVPSVPASTGDQDGLPVAMLEAMAASRPVVASRLAGIDEVIVDGRNGRLVPPGDEASLARALQEVLTADEGQRRRLGAAAAETAARYSVDAIADRYATLIERVASNTPR